MKRVVAITVMLVIVTSLFTFSVFADTPVQPLQVITYSDTTTNVRISGTAERLHYNVDSFQVVFMNPPNNYGTACTPVLVSFRFYNASDIPAYVGQTEFELTATTGTGAVNTIIYGYDQISTDLFVAESSYSTAEVGRIGIGASNDFAYYTGFVIPPRTSLYFSCIVYVNASAYAQNNTGATEDVNQVTLSALNLYSNQISFSEDYPYHNQPVDFSSIIDAITDLSDVVSTSTEMQELISMLTYSGNVYDFDGGTVNSYTATQTLENNYGSVNVQRYLYPAVISYIDVNQNNSDDTTSVNGTIRRPFFIKIDEYFSRNLQINYQSNLYYLFPSNASIYINYFYSSHYKGIVNTLVNNRIETYFFDDHYYMNSGDVRKYSIAHYGYYNTYIIGYVEYDVDANVVWNNVNPVNFIRNYSSSDRYMPDDEYTILRDLYLSLVENAANDNTEEAQYLNDDIHEKEQVWYDNNSDALEAVGLSNYRFSQSQSSGITTAVTQFQAVWNALGNWTNVYIFILILSISTYIIRHEPTTRVKQYRSSVQAERAERISYYGRKNAESRASSSGSTLKNAIRRRK